MNRSHPRPVMYRFSRKTRKLKFLATQQLVNLHHSSSRKLKEEGNCVECRCFAGLRLTHPLECLLSELDVGVIRLLLRFVFVQIVQTARIRNPRVTRILRQLPAHVIIRLRLFWIRGTASSTCRGCFVWRHVCCEHVTVSVGAPRRAARKTVLVAGGTVRRR